MSHSSSPLHAEFLEAHYRPTPEGPVIALRIETKEQGPMDFVMHPSLAIILVGNLQAELSREP